MADASNCRKCPLDKNSARYREGYSGASLLAILFAIPFGLRVLVHKEAGRWANGAQAFYHAHLELFLGNACLGVGVMMLLALTVERYVSVCHPGRTRPLMGPPRVVVALIPLLTFVAYLPAVFRERLHACLLPPLNAQLVYYKVPNRAFLDSLPHKVYVVVLEVVFKVGPTVLLAALNLRIMQVYRRSCERRRRMTRAPVAASKGADGGASTPNHHPEDQRHFAEERRLILLLGSTSVLFLLCVSPMVFLNITLNESNLSLFSYQVFRAIANLLEVTNYSMTFYIYCLFSEDFRNTLLRTFRWPWRCCGDGSGGGGAGGGGGCGGGGGGRPGGGGGGGEGGGGRGGGGAKALLDPRQGTPPTTTTTTTTTTTAGGPGAAVPRADPKAPPATPVSPARGARRLWLGLGRGCAGCCARRGYKQAEARAAV